MRWADSLQAAIDYMEAHLLEDIAIDDIARTANMSGFHFQRTFAVLTDVSVGEYLRRRRLTLAAYELVQSDGKVIDLAWKYGYETPEAFSKAFRKQHGMTPTDARKNRGQLTTYNRLVLQVTLKGADPMNFRVTEVDGFQVAGIRREFSLTNDQQHAGIAKIWDKALADGTDDQLFRLNNGPVKGALGVCVDKAADTMEYWIGTAVDGEVPEQFSVLDIPAAKWAVFEVRGPMPDAMTRVWKQIFTEWFPSSGYQHAGTPELEVYTDEDPSNPDLCSEIWIPVK